MKTNLTRLALVPVIALISAASFAQKPPAPKTASPAPKKPVAAAKSVVKKTAKKSIKAHAKAAAAHAGHKSVAPAKAPTKK